MRPDNYVPHIISGQESASRPHNLNVLLLEGRSLLLSGVHSLLMLSLCMTPRTKLGAPGETRPKQCSCSLPCQVTTLLFVWFC